MARKFEMSVVYVRLALSGRLWHNLSTCDLCEDSNARYLYGEFVFGQPWDAVCKTCYCLIRRKDWAELGVRAYRAARRTFDNEPSAVRIVKDWYDGRQAWPVHRDPWSLYK